MQDIVVYIDLQTQAPPRPTLLPLILSFEGEAAYKEYSNAAAVAVDFPGEASPTSLCAAALFGQANLTVGPIAKAAVVGVASDATTADITAALDALRETNDEWYFLIPTVANPSIIEALAVWVDKSLLTKEQIIAGEIESEKLLVAQTSQNTAITEALLELDNVAVCHNHDTANSYMHAAWVGRVAPNYPRVPPWKWKQLAGIPVTNERGTDAQALLEQRYNLYVDNHGKQYTAEGVCTNGEFIDVVIARWQIKQLMRSALVNLFVSNEEVPYDDDGFAQVAAVLFSAMNQATDNGIILVMDGVGQFVLNIPTRAQATPEQAAARTMPDITWEATLRGGIHGVRVYGTLTISLVGGQEA